MIELIFYYGTDIILIKINGNNVTFSNSAFGATQSTIEGLKIDKVGAIKENPDLKDNPDWKKISIGRFKEKIKSILSEDGVADYIINDLRKFGYKPKYRQKNGFRREAIR